MHKVFISHHHGNDQWYKEKLVEFGEEYSIFVDRSVDTGDIPDEWTDQQIRREIRDRYLRDSTVTVVFGRERDEAPKTRRLGNSFEHVRRFGEQAIGGWWSSTSRGSPTINSLRPMGMKKRSCCIRTLRHGRMSMDGQSTSVGIHTCLIASSTTL